MPRVDIRARFRGLDEVLRAAERLPEEAQREIAQARDDLADRLADIVRAAGEADSRQSGRAADTVRSGNGGEMVVAGPHPLLFGSEFGANGRFGWYSDGRYRDSAGRQFRPHIGSASYWFFRTIRENQPMIDDAWRQAADAIVRAWGA